MKKERKKSLQASKEYRVLKNHRLCFLITTCCLQEQYFLLLGITCFISLFPSSADRTAAFSHYLQGDRQTPPKQ